MTDNELRAQLREALRRTNFIGVETGSLGKLESGVPVFDVPARPGFYYVKVLRGDGVSYREALGLNVRKIYGLRVVVQQDQNGTYVITGVDSSDVLANGLAAINAAVGEHTHNDPIPTRRLLDGLVYLTSPASLSVRIAPFPYPYNGAWVWYPGGVLDLTSNVPSTSGKRRLVLVGVDPTTNTASAIDGSDYPITATLTRSHIAEIDPDTLVPLAAVNMYNAMSSISKENQFIDARLFLESAVGAGSAGAIDDILTDATGAVMVDANGNVMYGA